MINDQFRFLFWFLMNNSLCPLFIVYSCMRTTSYTVCDEQTFHSATNQSATILHWPSCCWGSHFKCCLYRFSGHRLIQNIPTSLLYWQADLCIHHESTHSSGRSIEAHSCCNRLCQGVLAMADACLWLIQRMVRPDMQKKLIFIHRWIKHPLDWWTFLGYTLHSDNTCLLSMCIYE